MNKTLEQQIIDHYESADLEQINEGLTWYERAHEEAQLISQAYDKPMEIVVGVMSALSPNNKWTRNIFDTWALFETPSINTKCCTFKRQREKALKIMNLAYYDDDVIKGVLGNGQKTRNFYDNILHYRTSDVVTVDMWAYRSVGLKELSKNFNKVSTAYKNVSKQLRLRPHQLQAVVWGVVRGSAL